MPVRYLFIFMAIYCLSGCDRETDSPPAPPVIVKAITVESEQSLPNRRYPARIVASDLTELSFKRSGVLTSLLPREGVRIKKGDPIASLEDTETRLLLLKRESASDVAQRQFSRYAELARRHLISQAELDVHRQQRDTALAALKLAKEEMADLHMKAPFDGVIAKIHQKKHTFIPAGQPVVTLNRTDTLDVIFTIPERVVKTLDLKNSHQPFHVELSALPGENFAARYKEHATNSDHGTLTWQITLTLPRPAQWSDTAGLSGSVKLPADVYRSEAGSPAVSIPVSALFTPEANLSGEGQVWVINQHEHETVIEPRRVRLGQMTDARIEITAGLTAGEKIVVAGVQFLKPHQQVKLWQREPGL